VQRAAEVVGHRRKSLAVLGRAHLPSSGTRVVCGAMAIFRGTVKRCICGWLACARSCAAPLAVRSSYVMLELAGSHPDLAHENVLHVTEVFPRMEMVYGPPAFTLGRTSSHCPLALVMTLRVCPSMLAEMDSPASAHPQMWTGCPCCTTM